MGPEATAELFLRIIKATPAEKDQDHLRIIIDNNPKIPDRTADIIGGGPSSLPEMMKTAKNLEKAGADFIIMPCNTAHYYYEELSKTVHIPVLNMIELSAKRIKDDFPDVRKVGILATTGTVKTKIYDQSLSRVSVQVIVPDDDMQDVVMKAIYNIKAGCIREERQAVMRAANHLIEKGAEAVICGCTEVSLVLKSGDVTVPVIDPLQVLAETAVEVAMGKD